MMRIFCLIWFPAEMCSPVDLQQLQLLQQARITSAVGSSPGSNLKEDRSRRLCPRHNKRKTKETRRLILPLLG